MNTETAEQWALLKQLFEKKFFADGDSFECTWYQVVIDGAEDWYIVELRHCRLLYRRISLRGSNKTGWRISGETEGISPRISRRLIKYLEDYLAEQIPHILDTKVAWQHNKGRVQ